MPSSKYGILNIAPRDGMAHGKVLVFHVRLVEEQSSNILELLMENVEYV